MRKGQIFSTDLLVALAITALLWGSLVLEFHSFERRSQDAETTHALELQAMQIVDQLTLSPGVPSAWETTGGAQALGLAQTPNVLSNEKLAAFFALAPDEIRNQLNIPPHRFRFRILASDGTPLASVGDLDSTRKTPVIALRRPAVTNATTTIVEFTLQ
jgi:hypothetical protein